MTETQADYVCSGHLRSDGEIDVLFRALQAVMRRGQTWEPEYIVFHNATAGMRLYGEAQAQSACRLLASFDPTCTHAYCEVAAWQVEVARCLEGMMREFGETVALFARQAFGPQAETEVSVEAPGLGQSPPPTGRRARYDD